MHGLQTGNRGLVGNLGNARTAGAGAAQRANGAALLPISGSVPAGDPSRYARARPAPFLRLGMAGVGLVGGPAHRGLRRRSVAGPARTRAARLGGPAG